ncbi:chloride channel protein [Acidipropionibacterium virtanenii]|uniref:H(+)/Cl(-) exchange transporter ClcA n=1 Tax=Acidipropionibacterium virtanenii TaxID=2057246 RepID=A0A344UQ24_9ACTN|nr:chloride channel protein [Acidipropionibacterium virtanenii]AXE37372.1 H(+)/Cl(-) exchange transporter ClcA [Acidipropionibacterium virtanenii]
MPRSLRVILAVLAAGLVAGVAGGLLSLLNHGIETLAMGRPYFRDPAGVASVPTWRRICVPVIGGLAAGLVWTRLRRRGQMVSVRQSVDAAHPQRLSPDTVVDALAQLIIVGSGTSLGRETAPRQITGYLGQVISERFGLGREGRRTIIATASAAGLAAVYNVPLAGALYALELILKPDLRTRRGWLEVLAAAAVSGLATVTAWMFNGNAATYWLPHRSALQPSWHDGLVLLIIAMACLVGGGLFGRCVTAAKVRPVPVRALWWSAPLGSALVAVIALVMPQVPGNGQIMVQAVLERPLLLSTLGLMAMAKLLGTSIALRTGATGGLLTPSLAVGACLGAAVAVASGHTTAGDVAVFSVAGAGCLLAVTQEAPLFALAFILELVKAPADLITAVCAAVWLTWAGHLGFTRVLALWRGRRAQPDG